MGGSLALAYAFYVLIERPSHQLARKVKLFGPGVATPGGQETPVAFAPEA
jgi:hypothetical protein